MKNVGNYVLMLFVVALITACAPQPPQQTADGLQLRPDSKFQQVYLLPAVDFSAYQELGLSSCEVSFRKHWLRDQNDSRVDLSKRVTQEDVDKIKDQLGEECDKYFRAALLESPAYALVDNFDNGEDVLVVYPSIRNLDISAPDTMSTGMSQSYTTTAGEMTLQLELRDGTTGQVLGRVADKRKDVDSGRMQWTNSVTNRAAAERILKRWAAMLREGMDAVTGK